MQNVLEKIKDTEFAIANHIIFWKGGADRQYNIRNARKFDIIMSDAIESMVFNTGAALLDAIVLAVVSKDAEGTYGYKITQDVRNVLNVSESTLYPVLRRLQKEAYFDLYDRAIDGRNRRYYKITERGKEQLEMYKREWESYSKKISDLFEAENEGGNSHD